MNSKFITIMMPDEAFGGLSNLSEDFPLAVNGTRVLTSEHLYQALKFPDYPEIQKEILNKPSPIACRRIANKKDYRAFIQSDWKAAQLDVMEFCLKTKLVWHWVKFGDLLRATDDQPIYEISSNDDRYWGVADCNVGLVGENHLGKLLMKLRDELCGDCNEHLRTVSPPGQLGLKFLGQVIETNDRRNHLRQLGTRTTEWVNAVRP